MDHCPSVYSYMNLGQIWISLPNYFFMQSLLSLCLPFSLHSSSFINLHCFLTFIVVSLLSLVVRVATTVTVRRGPAAVRLPASLRSRAWWFVLRRWGTLVECPPLSSSSEAIVVPLPWRKFWLNFSNLAPVLHKRVFNLCKEKHIFIWLRNVIS